ncbi:MAG: hypothetical protein GY936_00410 [Ignavibacteriae bacterium]|nr:hypothetical protein [Ignavibacteriota bacterium]
MNSRIIPVRDSAFAPDYKELSRDLLIEGALKICSMAQRHYRKEIIRGGGGYAFSGFATPQHLAYTHYGTYHTVVTRNTVTVTGIGKITGIDGVNPIKVTYIVSPEYIKSATFNN